MKIDEKTTLADVLELSGAEDILLKYNVPCMGCPMAKMEMHDLTIGQIAATYGIDKDKLLADLNMAAAKYINKE